LERCQKRKRALEARLVSALDLREGILDCLKNAARVGIRLGVVSSSPSRWVLPHLERLVLGEYFEVIVTREDAERAKPHPDLYLVALSRLGVHAAGTVAVEDSANGVTAAVAAGIRCIAYPNSVTRRQDLTHANAVVDGSDLWTTLDDRPTT